MAAGEASLKTESAMPATRNFKLLIEYDGTRFAGWQRQKADRTVQGEIEKGLRVMTGEKVSLIGSGRTDAGVHALGQVANFRSPTRLTPRELQRGLNSLTPADLVIRDVREVAPGFHARFDARSKVYHYRIRNHPLPAAVGRHYAWHIERPLDLERMNQGARMLVGEADFKSFEGSGSPRAHTVRRIFRAGWTREPSTGVLVFQVEANGFLRFMVRNMVGTLVEIGLGKREASQLPAILAARDRGAAAPTAPAHGLFLMEVTY